MLAGGWLAAGSHGDGGAHVASSLVGRARRRRCTGGVGAVARCASDARDRAAAGPGAAGGLGGADFDVNFYITQRSVSEKLGTTEFRCEAKAGVKTKSTLSRLKTIGDMIHLIFRGSQNHGEDNKPHVVKALFQYLLTYFFSKRIVVRSLMGFRSPKSMAKTRSSSITLHRRDCHLPQEQGRRGRIQNRSGRGAKHCGFIIIVVFWRLAGCDVQTDHAHY
uniref:Uncharacterized protein n=1 Tax=Aegilops tauschii TaxID=37682 RepID=M8C1J9_AEGTA